jgi:hypothetical protein
VVQGDDRIAGGGRAHSAGWRSGGCHGALRGGHAWGMCIRTGELTTAAPGRNLLVAAIERPLRGR